VDFEKAFDSLDREALWRILRHYGMPNKIINMLKVQYQGFNSQVLHRRTMTEPTHQGQDRCETGMPSFAVVVPCGT